MGSTARVVRSFFNCKVKVSLCWEGQEGKIPPPNIQRSFSKEFHFWRYFFYADSIEEREILIVQFSNGPMWSNKGTSLKSMLVMSLLTFIILNSILAWLIMMAAVVCKGDVHLRQKHRCHSKTSSILFVKKTATRIKLPVLKLCCVRWCPVLLHLLEYNTNTITKCWLVNQVNSNWKRGSAMNLIK